MSDDAPGRHILLDALWRRPHAGVPVWFMRQAGRYLPGYQRVRAQTDFLTLCKTPDLAAEVTVEPLDTLGVDAVIIFSDILVPLEAMGLPVTFTDRGPCMEKPIDDAADVAALRPVDPVQDTGFVLDIIREVRERVAGRVPVIGFAGAPWTLACYALEGSPSRTFAKAMRMVYREPATLHDLLDRIARTVTEYLRAQVEAGAQAVQIFDTWGGMLADDVFEEISLEYCRRIVRELDGCGVPRILFIKGGGAHLDAIAATGAEAVGVDYTMNLARAREVVAGRAAIQGNLPPECLYGPLEQILARADRRLDAMVGEPGYVFNLGHGIQPGTPVEHVRALVDHVHSQSK